VVAGDGDGRGRTRRSGGGRGPAGRGGTDGRGGDRAEHHDNDRIDADKATMTADGVSAVVVDELDNVVGVFARHPRPALHDRLVATYGLDAIG
jgi:hypothetical protein